MANMLDCRLFFVFIRVLILYFDANLVFSLLPDSSVWTLDWIVWEKVDPEIVVWFLLHEYKVQFITYFLSLQYYVPGGIKYWGWIMLNGGMLIIADVNNRKPATEASCINSLYSSLLKRWCVSFLSPVTIDVLQNSFGLALNNNFPRLKKKPWWSVGS